MVQPLPIADDYERDAAIESEMQWRMDFILGIRQIRGEMDIKPSLPLPIILENANELDREFLERGHVTISTLARIESTEFLDDGAQAPASATAVLGNMIIHVPMQGIIDIDAEIMRLSRQIKKRSAELTKSEQKLSNERFVNNAPADVVEKERHRADELRTNLSHLQENLSRVESLQS